MGMSIGEIDLGLDINQKLFNKQLNDISRGAESKVANAFGGLGRKIGVTLGVAAVASFTKQCLELGSNLSEVQNVVDVTFTTMNESVNNFAKNAISQFGLSETVAKKYMGTTGAMAKAFGFTENEAYNMSEAITGLTGDVASFYNTSTDEAFTKLKSIFTGETEALKELGIVMTQTALDQYALNNGFGKTTAKMTEQEKAMLRYQFVTSQLSAASGDFMRTQDGWANQTRVLALRFDALKASIGQGLINVLTPCVKALNILIGRLQVAADAFSAFTANITGVKKASSSISNVTSDMAGLTTNIADVGDTTADTAKQIEKSLAGFDQITKLSDVSDSSSSSISSSNNTSSGQGNLAEIDNTSKKINGLSSAIDKFANDINWKEIKKSLGNFWDALKPLLSAFWDGIKIGLGDIYTVLTGFIGLVAPPIFNSLAELLKDVDPEAMKNIGRALVDVGAALVAFKIGSAITAGLASVAASLSTLATLGAIVVTLSIVWDAVDNWKKLIDYAEPSEIGTALMEFLWGDSLNILEYAGEKLSESWDDIKKFTNKLLDGDLQGAVEKFADFGENLLEGLCMGILGGINWLLEPIYKMAGAVKDWFCNLLGIHSPSTVFKGFGQYIVQGLVIGIIGTIQLIRNVITNMVDNIKSAFNINNIVSFFTSAANSIIWCFSSLGNRLGSIFSNAWNGVKNIFSTGSSIFVGIQDGITSTFRHIVNSLISGINSIIRTPFNKINEMLNTIRNIKIFGSKVFSNFWSKNPIVVPNIPFLAQGGYVQANSPQLAMIGDNRHQGEVVAPEDKLLEMARTASQMSGNASLTLEMLAILKEILKVIKELDLNIVIDGRTLKDIIVEKINANTKATGVCEIIT